MWIAKNEYLSHSEMLNNAKLIWGYFGSKGCTLNAVCAMLGNMQHESSINPGIWEGLEPFPSEELRGYGLVQWTPWTKYANWAGSDWQNNGNKQCERIMYEAENGIQWFSNPEAPIIDPPLSFKQFLHSDKAVATLANYFLWYYEHPAVTIQPDRASDAEKWYQELTGETPIPPDPDPGPNSFRSMPIYFYTRIF